MNLSQFKDIAAIVGVVLAIITLFFGFVQFGQQVTVKRTELFLKMRDRYSEFKDICSHLEKDSSPKSRTELLNMPFDQKRHFIGFYEEIALMMNSGLLRRDVAHYMFGYYAIRCWQSNEFWNDQQDGLDRKSPYWGLFRDFAQKMELIESEFSNATTDFGSLKF